MESGWRRWLAMVVAGGLVALLAPQAAAWWLRPEVATASPPPAGEPILQVVRELREAPVLGEHEPSLAPAAVPPLPDTPLLAPVHEARFGATVQRISRCSRGDALVTVERPKEGITWVVVHRAGRLCFRMPFPDGPDQTPATLRVHGTVDASGEAGPLALVHAHPLQPEIGESGRMIRREEVHLIVVGLDGELLLERAIETRSGTSGGPGGLITFTPAVWDDGALLAWSSARRWEAQASQCLGSLLRLQPRGPVAVAEGVPCELTGVRDVDGDGLVELLAATHESDGTPWEAVVTTAGDFAATSFSAGTSGMAQLVETDAAPALLLPPASQLAGSRLVPWPWSEGGVELPPDEGVRLPFDWDGDGTQEVVLARGGGSVVVDAAGREQSRLEGRPLAGRIDGVVRELVVEHGRCGLAAVGHGGEVRCAPGDMGTLEEVLSAGSSFDWTADGTADVTAVGSGLDGRLWLAAWAEGDLTFAWTAENAELLLPRHQAPRALSLTAEPGPEVLVATEDGFAVRAVPGGEERWRDREQDGVLDAWALPASGPSAVAVR